MNYTYVRPDCEEVEIQYDYCLEDDMLVIDGDIYPSSPITKEEEKIILELIADELDKYYYENQHEFEMERDLGRADALYDYWKENN